MPTKPLKPKSKPHRPHEGYRYKTPATPPQHPALLSQAEIANKAHRSWHVQEAHPLAGGTIIETLFVGERGSYEVYQARPDGTYWTGTYDPERGVTLLNPEIAKRHKDFDGGDLFFDLAGAIFKEEDLAKTEE